MKNLKKEVDIAVTQTPTQVGQYQLSFLDHLRHSLELLKKQADDASTWLHLFNRRQSSSYWAMNAKYGTKFSLSEERGLATSIG
jgi:hypothetical protein